MERSLAKTRRQIHPLDLPAVVIGSDARCKDNLRKARAAFSPGALVKTRNIVLSCLPFEGEHFYPSGRIKPEVAALGERGLLFLKERFPDRLFALRGVSKRVLGFPA